jgi:FkbM family methyltransferase
MTAGISPPAWRAKKYAHSAVRAVLRSAGYSISRSEQSPLFSWNGLTRLPIRTVLDVGANEGQFATWIGGIFPDATVHCFEPLPEAAAELRRRTNGNAAVVVHNVALGDTSGQVPFFWHHEHSPSSSMLATTARNEAVWPQTRQQRVVSVPMTTLDSVMAGREWEPDLLVKMDVQGYEDRVIRGGHAVFRAAAACVAELILIPLYDSQARSSDVIGALHDLGLEYAGNMHQSHLPDGSIAFVDALFLRPASNARGHEPDRNLGHVEAGKNEVAVKPAGLVKPGGKIIVPERYF